jgi:hypothetical protein
MVWRERAVKNDVSDGDVFYLLRGGYRISVIATSAAHARKRMKAGKILPDDSTYNAALLHIVAAVVIRCCSGGRADMALSTGAVARRFPCNRSERGHAIHGASVDIGAMQYLTLTRLIGKAIFRLCGAQQSHRVTAPPLCLPRQRFAPRQRQLPGFFLENLRRKGRSFGRILNKT